MPNGIKLITTLNILLAGLLVISLLYLNKAGQGAPLFMFMNLVSAGALVLITLIVLLRLVRLVGFARALAYTVILVLGLQLLMMLEYLMTVYGALTIFVDLIVIFYSIGMRGYLGSDKVKGYFLRNSC